MPQGEFAISSLTLFHILSSILQNAGISFNKQENLVVEEHVGDSLFPYCTLKHVYFFRKKNHEKFSTNHLRKNILLHWFQFTSPLDFIF